MIRPLFRLPLVFQMLLGLVLGLGVGLLWPDFGASLRPIGTAFVEAVKMIVIPVVFAAVTLGLYRMGSELKVLGRIAAISLGYFYLATVISILIGLLLNAAFHPGAGAPLAATGKVPQNLAVSVDWIKFFMDMIPSNIVAAMAEQKILPTLVFAILFGLALASSGKVGEPMVAVLEAVMAAMFKITKWITSLAPIAIFAVMAWLFATQGLATVVALAKLVGVMYLGLAIMVAIFWLMLLAIGEKPLAVTKAVMEPMILAFSTRSSEVTLPLHMEKLRAMGASERIVSVVLPLGYAFNRDGAIMYFALAVTFLAEAYGVTLTWSTLFTIVMVTTIASKGSANVPSGGLVAIAMVLSAIGLPIEALAVIAGVDAFLDMGRTAINVFGNTVAVKLVEKFAGDMAADETQPTAAGLQVQDA
ncbi:DAACS family dicarboxylate/amino acid:cation (Na+ or H+) symporter [Bradyrhizobium diazoefficiens]|uniref:Proton glutamate symport protein n=1 Tax=Bradyrhizobium diazoefficiens TaxID=1355477 RepID=A0A0E4BW16_9BRAD|nr:dicarboxylate/amino acid:cation symporter [Bradyrhizobium diazoefficiens]MBR0862972.1 dicarboxylate/amino acid:cation symporter [Bradyrhizobium diazoefficiens]MBR0887535.1 dicarboxylate/amino acid:cation symporter [Bradyrhizobium diazoefficiens]MBR0919358.1 dicarboxylate/amino acid:cation symporter [Bradyrhizobium diazoefficiens]BAR61351.1 proton glutamate symport protein [Bradyrhizobium diazoefficiens]